MKQVLYSRNDDERTHFYTGLPSYAVFNVLLSKLAPQICDMGSVGSGLSVGDEFLLVLMKLSRALTNQDLAYRFGTHVTKVTKVFHRWIDLMAVTLKPLIAWPDKGMVLSTLPASTIVMQHALSIVQKCSLSVQLLLLPEPRPIPIIRATIQLNFWLLSVLQEQLFTYLNAGVDEFLTSI